MHKKVKKDSEQLAALARALRTEALKHKQNPLTPALLERIQVLERRAQELQAAVAAVDENFLSVPGLTSAEEIRSEAKWLQETFAHSRPEKQGKKLRALAREIEKHAGSLADRMRLP